MKNTLSPNKSQINQVPEDLCDDDDTINSVSEKAKSLCDFFNSKEGDKSAIKNWSTNFNSDSMKAFCEILSTILQLSGKRMDITPEHIESDAYDIVIEEFQEELETIKTRKRFKSPKSSPSRSIDFESVNPSENTNENDDESNSCDETETQEENETNQSNQIIPIINFLKDKTMSKVFVSFWHELSEVLLSCNAIYDQNFNKFRQWLIQFNKCQIRVLRLTSTYCCLSLFNELVISLNRSKNELDRLHKLESDDDPNPILRSQKKIYEQNVELYRKVSFYFLQNALFSRISDSDDVIRLISIQSLTDAAIDCPSEFADGTKLECFIKVLHDHSSKNRRDVLRCIQRIIDNCSNPSIGGGVYVEKLKPLAVHFIPIIINLCNDRDNSVVASALDCLNAFNENQLLTGNSDIVELCMTNASTLLSDDSQAIRAASARFISKLLLTTNSLNSSDESLSSLKSLLPFLLSNFTSSPEIEGELPVVISSLFNDMPCLHDWDAMCDILTAEKDPNKSRIMAKVLLYSSERLLDKNFSLSTPSMNQPSNENDNNEVRKMAVSLVRHLPMLIKEYQDDDDIILPLVDAAKLINLDIVSESGYESFFQKLLEEVCNIFLFSSNRLVFRTAIASLYDLSVSKHQLGLMARRELDRLAVECGNECDVFECISQSSQNAIEAVIADQHSIAKFVAAARLVDISDNGKLRTIVINRINTLSQALTNYLDESNSIHYDEKMINDLIQVLSDSLECLQYIFMWDIKHIHKNKELKMQYIPKFKENLSIFYQFLTTDIITGISSNGKKTNVDEDDDDKSENTLSPLLIKEQAFKGLGDVIALSSFLRDDKTNEFFDDALVDEFYSSYHCLFNKSTKIDLFKYALHPIQTRSIELSNAAHLFVYFGYASLQLQLKMLWKDITQGRSKLVLRGKHLFKAMVLSTSTVNRFELRLATRFMLGKLSTFEFIQPLIQFEINKENGEELDLWLQLNDERYETLLSASLPFFFGLTKDNADQLLSFDDLPFKFREILESISKNEKPSQKALQRVVQTPKSNQSRVLSSPQSKKVVEPVQEVKTILKPLGSSNSTNSDSDDIEEE